MWATYFNSILSASFIFVTIVCTTVPARADVDITAAQAGDTNEVIISLGATSETNLVRAFAFGGRPDNKANISEVTDTNDCLKASDPGYSTWEALGKGNCWCYRHQCQGDAVGFAEFGGIYVSLVSLNVLRAEFGKTITELQNAGSHACADFDHLSAFGRPVGLSDLNILKANFGVRYLPDCPMTHLNFYTEP